MTDARLLEALARAAELSREPFGGSWVDGWAEMARALDAEQRRHYPIRPTKQGSQAITKFCDAMVGMLGEEK